MANRTGMGDGYIYEEAGTVFLGNALIELSFSLKSGRWTAIRDRVTGRVWSSPEAEVPSTLLRVNGRRRGEGVVRNSRVFALDGAQEIGWQSQLQQYSATLEDSALALTLECQEGDWTISSIYRLSPGDNTVSRSLRVAYQGEGEATLHDVRFLAPPIQIRANQATWVEAPGYPVVSHFPAEEIAEGVWPGLDSRTLTEPGLVQHSVDAPGSVAGLVAVHFPEEPASLLFWPHSTHEFSIMEMEKRDQGLLVSQWLFLADRFTNGHQIETGYQYLRLAHGDWESVLKRWQPWYETVQLTTPDDRPLWAFGTAICEVHVGRAPFLGGLIYEPYPHMADLTNDLPRICGLGFKIVQLMPHWPFCGYTVHRYEDIDQQYGEASELKTMVQTAHHLGLKVILDVVLHGAIDREIVRWNMEQYGPRYHFIFGEWLKRADERSRYRDEHPEWFMQDEDGHTARIYTWAFDHANPGYQDYLVSVLRFYLDELGVDGFRFDAPTWNCMPNWNRSLPARPSSAYYAPHHLMAHVRKSIKASHPLALLYTEPSGPLFRHTVDLTYNYDEEWITGSLLPVVSPRGYAGARTYTGKPPTVREIAEWMHYQRYTLPEGAMTVHHLDSHDTFWWGEMAQFRREAFGGQAARAMFAFFALVGGGLMSYIGAEKGSEDFYRDVIHLRYSLSALRLGYCDFLAIHADHPRVLPLLRQYGGAHAIPVINFSAEPVETRLSIPLDRLGLLETDACLVIDVLNHATLGAEGQPRQLATALSALQVDLAPYGVKVLQVVPLSSARVTQPTSAQPSVKVGGFAKEFER